MLDPIHIHELAHALDLTTRGTSDEPPDKLKDCITDRLKI
jgi:hypothetical protein